MRVCSYLGEDGPGLGVIDGDALIPLLARDLRELMGEEPEPPAPASLEVPVAGARLLAPLRPGKLIGIGLNYRDHAAETGTPLPARPLLFAKMPTAVTGTGAAVRIPAYTTQLDYEGELAVVIGRAAAAVPAEDALDHVFGYAVLNDLTARDRQRDEPQWVRAKGGDGFAPMGPWVTTADEVPDPQALRIRTWVNGEPRQDGSTADMVVGVAELIAFISASFTLEPGDVITTGTPAGVGTAMDPPRYLAPGDVVRVEVEGLGAIETPIEGAG